MKRYRISAFSRRSGIPADTLRYYEKLGLITSMRQEDNDYRTYDDYDLLFSAQLRMLRSVDMPLALLKPHEKPHTLDTIERHLNAEETQLTAQISAMQDKLTRVRLLARELEECRQSAGTCREAEYPETLNLNLPDCVPDDHLSQMIARWQSAQPFVHVYCVLDEDARNAACQGPMQAKLGFGVLASYAEKLNLPTSAPVVRKYPSSGVRCVLKVRDPLRPALEEFQPLTEYLAATGRTTWGEWQYRIRFIDQQEDGSQVCYIAMRVNVCPIES